ncbi:hypothetical protein J8273_6116 [Carpediemonas membranifera]|uniref:Chromo domain-containing protein n=1 Tax=Carpediemonas membranifera TaxID=201153 RepID=A0A8J6AQF5_9EUKA|nr:hypothetical protein J8273_6116 [Carpediemonas membranifera]|eukprot:KAG9391366.1 hypothetical protein J8273_6116 [Carpediemonas membranifera]
MKEDAWSKAASSRTEILSRFVLLSPGWRGPMRRVNCIKQDGIPVAYEVQDLTEGRRGNTIKVDAARVRKFNPGTLSESQIRQIAATALDEYEIDRISDDRGAGPVTKREYLVHWLGFEDD